MTIYVSLGKQCHIATELKKRGLRKTSLPYDWLYIGNFSDIVNLLNNKNSQLMNFKAWELYDKESNQFKNNLLTNLKSRHFYKSDLSNFDEVSELFQKRTDRLFQFFEGDEHINFIRDEQWYELDEYEFKKYTQSFYDFLNENYPKLNWTLTYLMDSTNEKKLYNFEMKNIRIIYVHSNNSKEWNRPVNPWDFVFM